MSAKFYICRHCGNLVGMIHDSGVPMMCCGQKMVALEPNTVEASGEKHLPVVTMEEGAINVRVGSVNHPMVPEHFIGSMFRQSMAASARHSSPAMTPVSPSAWAMTRRLPSMHTAISMVCG